MKIKIICSVALLLSLVNMYGQQESNYSPLFQLPPSPDAAALGKYGQYPVNMANGLVQIDIPIHTINLPGFNMPVSISYHPSGIRVNEISSVVGLGWSLNAGGVITRSVKGAPDLKFGTSEAILSVEFIQSLGRDGVNESVKINHLDRLARAEQRGGYDSESDVYYYNVCGLSGSFRFDTRGNLVQIPLSDHKIEYNTGTDTFVITDTDGTVYTFQDREKTNLPTGGGKYTSSWYISHIKTTDNQQVSFEYTADNTLYHDYYEGTLLSVQYNYSNSKHFEYIRRGVASDNTLLVKNINFPGGSLQFSYNNDRADRRKNRLTLITLRNNQQALRTFWLRQSYFARQGTMTIEQVGNPGHPSDNYIYRLKLDQLDIKDRNGAEVEQYVFGYNTTQSLPPYFDPAYIDRKHYAQDLWGYYNGANNQNLLTYNKFQGYYELPNHPPANRDVNTECAQAGILNKISYPTGGVTLFEYESNRNTWNRLVGGLRIKNILSYQDIKDDPIVKSYDYADPKDNNWGDLNYLKGTAYTQGRVEPGEYGPAIEVYDYYLSEPVLPLSYVGGATVLYGKVTEYEGYPDNSNGKAVYNFFNGGNDIYVYNISHCILQYYPSPQNPLRQFHPYLTYSHQDRSWLRGQVKGIEVYKKENNEFLLMKRTEHQYKVFNREQIPVGFRSFANYDYGDYSMSFIPATEARDLYQYADIYATTGLLKLAGTIETTYTAEGDSIRETTSYFYDKLNNQYEVSAVHQQRSDGSVLKRNFLYPNDLKSTHPFCNLLSQYNILSPVILQTDSLDNKFLRSVQTNYKQINAGMIKPHTVVTKQGDGDEETEITYQVYDSSTGNLRHFIKQNYTDEVICWGYNHTLPVAKFDNITYSSVNNNTVLMGYINQLQNFTTLNTQATRESLRAINRGIRENLPANALVVTYTYEPLVGITSHTDPQGITTYYQYDAFQRLSEVYIQEGNEKKYLQTYEYKYDNE